MKLRLVLLVIGLLNAGCAAFDHKGISELSSKTICDARYGNCMGLYCFKTSPWRETADEVLSYRGVDCNNLMASKTESSRRQSDSLWMMQKGFEMMQTPTTAPKPSVHCVDLGGFIHCQQN